METTRRNQPAEPRPAPREPAPNTEHSETAEGGARQEDRIARRAYERFEERGREHGHDVEDWLEAEREIGSRGE
jgi:hypothetical protein